MSQVIVSMPECMFYNVEVPVTFISSHPQTMTYLIGMWINLIA